jgi:UDP-GlcNAc:undecaprenyl-phosphate/decaprenyl-phosphate GlcNAc-1-phosphate transferase
MIWMIVSFVSALASGLLLIRQAEAWAFVDTPEARKIHILPTPRTGGLAIAIAIAIGFSLWLTTGHPWPTGLPWQTVSAGVGFTLIGALDDRFHFHPRQKVLWFLAMALLAAWPWAFQIGSRWMTATIGNYQISAPRSLGYLLLTLWFLAVPNAVNIEDAINGYMGGFTLLILIVGLMAALPLWIPTGAVLGFLLLNWPRAKHFMGDAGSFGCGFIIAECLLRIGGANRPLLALALTAPISLDVAMGLVRRRRLGMGPFDADRSTCPHHMVNLCRQSHTLATPLLLANAAVFAYLAYRPGYFLVLYTFAYITVLLVFNRASLTKRVHTQEQMR